MPEWTGPPLPARWGAGSRRVGFVGRRAEWRTLDEAWQLAAGGARQVVFVSGEAGVGKSRLVAEVATVLHARRAAVLLGWCVSGLGAPYQPFVQPMSNLMTAITRGALAEGTAAAHATIIERLAVVTGASQIDETANRHQQFTRQLFDACLEAVTAATQALPLVVILEDLHWAGETALQLLSYLIQQTADIPLLILATLRTSVADRKGSLIDQLSPMYRMDGVTRVELDGLGADDIADYLHALTGVTASGAKIAAPALREQTAGNPFLLQEVLRELDGRGGLSALREITVSVPESVLDTVSHRLNGLPPGHRRTVELAAVIADDVPVDVLTAVLQSTSPHDWSPEQVFAGLESATAEGLMESGREGGTFRFRHALARQAVLDLMSEYQRATDHASVATTLEEQFPAADLRTQRLAHHYANAQSLGFTAKAVKYLLLAATSAAASLAHHEAARLFEQAASITRDIEQRDALRLSAARSYLRSSNFGKAQDLNELVAATAGGVVRLRAAIGLEAASWRTAQPGGRSVRLLESALAAADIRADDPLRIRGIAALGRAEMFSGHAEKASEHQKHALELARRIGDERLVATVLQIGLQRVLTPENLTVTLGDANELSGLADRIGDLRHLAPAGVYRAAISYTRGDLAAFEHARNDLTRAARATGQPYWEWATLNVDFAMHYMHADFRLARRTITEAEELGRSFGSGGDTTGPSGLQNYMVRRESGQLERVRPMISGLEDPSSSWAPGLLALYCEFRLREAAERVLKYLLDREIERHQRSSIWPAVLSFLCEAAIWMNDQDAAARLVPFLARYSGLNLVAGELVVVFGSADRLLGSLESLLGISTAGGRFEAARAMDSRMNSPVHLATTLAAHAAHLVRVRDASSQLTSTLEAARRIATVHGLARVSALLDDVEADRASQQPIKRPLAGLTTRESEVLRLMSRGMGNRAIAEALWISQNTAANHVRSILQKTGTANRTQAVLYATGNGLLRVDPDGRH
jgi:DNA-binding CsgD family transcriptional regulator